jgi:hypothetical protein
MLYMSLLVTSTHAMHFDFAHHRLSEEHLQDRTYASSIYEYYEIYTIE